jgi:hypothetical protein
MRFLIVFFFLTFFLRSFAQTTLEEYNYLTKGYKIQLESGLDMKKGYELLYIGDSNTAERKTQIFKLIRTSTRKTAAYLITYQLNGKEKEYICVPHPSSDKDILGYYWTTLYDGSNINSTLKLQLIAYLLTSQITW